MSDGGRERASIGVERWKSSQKWIAERSAVRCIARLGRLPANTIIEGYANTTGYGTTTFRCGLKSPFLDRRNGMRAEKRVIGFLDSEIACAARLINDEADKGEARLP